MEKVNQFTIRVYGLFIQEGHVLLSDEVYHGKSFTKFPGGGLEWGEGATDTLQREIKEELQVDIEIIDHFYTTDFFVASSFDASKQVISIYYRANFKKPLLPEQLTSKPDVISVEKGEWFRWESLANMHPSDLTFPIDKKVLQLLQEASI